MSALTTVSSTHLYSDRCAPRNGCPNEAKSSCYLGPDGRARRRSCPFNYYNYILVTLIIVAGLIIYFGYSLQHSKAAEAVVQQPRRPTHLNLTPIIPEIERDPARSNSGPESGIIRFCGGAKTS